MTKYLRISSYIRKLFFIYDFSTAPIWISLYMRNILLSFCFFKFYGLHITKASFIYCIASTASFRKPPGIVKVISNPSSKISWNIQHHKWLPICGFLKDATSFPKEGCRKDFIISRLFQIVKFIYLQYCSCRKHWTNLKFFKITLISRETVSLRSSKIITFFYVGRWRLGLALEATTPQLFRTSVIKY